MVKGEPDSNKFSGFKIEFHRPFCDMLRNKLMRTGLVFMLPTIPDRPIP